MSTRLTTADRRRMPLLSKKNFVSLSAFLSAVAMKTIHMKHLFLILLMLSLGNNGCDWMRSLTTTIKDSTTVVAQALDEAINQLGAESANFQQILDETLGSLPHDVSSTIRADISNTFQRGISAASSEVRCDIDFVRDRLRQSLQRLKAKILGNPMPDAEPQICNVVPVAVDMDFNSEQRNRLEFFGYDFDLSDVKVFLFNGATQTDVTAFLSKTTHYHMVLNLGDNGVRLNAQSSKLVLRNKDVDLSTIQVIQEAPEVCENTNDEKPINTIGFMPKHVRGDYEFGGNGPKITCTVTLVNRRIKVDAVITMTARETSGDKTMASGFEVFTVYTPDPGYEVTEIIGPTSANFSYTDNNNALDLFGGSGPVSKFVFMGDGPGDDVERHTRVEVTFNNLRVTLKENRNCVDGNTIRALVQQNALSAAKLNRIKAISPKILKKPPAFQ